MFVHFQRRHYLLSSETEEVQYLASPNATHSCTRLDYVHNIYTNLPDIVTLGRAHDEGWSSPVGVQDLLKWIVGFQQQQHKDRVHSIMCPITQRQFQVSISISLGGRRVESASA